MTEPARPNQILVLGTLAYETALIPGDASDPEMFQKKTDWVGGPIIQDMIGRALPPVPAGTTASALQSRLHPKDPRPGDSVKAECVELTTVFARFQQRSAGKKDDTVWRVKQNYRAAPGAKGDDYREHLQACIDTCSAPDIVVIYEQDPMFREALRRLAGDRTANRSVKEPEQHSSPVLIISLADAVEVESIEAAKTIFGNASTIVLVTADGLRRCGLEIVAYGSIEETVRQLSASLSQNPLNEILKQCSHLLVLFEETGAVCIDTTGSARQGSIHFCPNFDRVAQMDKEKYGRAPGRMAVALTAVTRAVDEWLGAEQKQPLDIASSLRLAVVAYNAMFDKGFDQKDPFDTVKNALSLKEQGTLEGLLHPADPKKGPDRELLVSSLDFPTEPDQLREWSRLDGVLKKTQDLALAVVLNGVEAACRDDLAQVRGALNRWWPSSQITSPFMQIGKLQTFDRDEIERFADLAKLMRKYHDDTNWSTPLSIAVFGPPGAGKSFAVKQLMKAINPAIKDSSILTFNLAQFDSLELLTEAFHQVQDQALSSDDVPLVIFDEFDSSFQASPLGWLKYFLAPMEDGVFRGRSANYKVGRAVFLFAGGTADSFADFTRARPASEEPDEDEPVEKSTNKTTPDNLTSPTVRVDKKAVKLPDFASRLMAHLDVLGINPPPRRPERQGESQSQKTRRRVRRATLLRSLLNEFAEPIIKPDKSARMSPEVVSAFLDDNVIYRNEARSMKAVVRGARLIGNRFLVASLPSQRLMKLHTQHWPLGKPPATNT